MEQLKLEYVIEVKPELQIVWTPENENNDGDLCDNKDISSKTSFVSTSFMILVWNI